MASLQERVEAYLQLGTGAASGANELLQVVHTIPYLRLLIALTVIGIT